MSGYRRNTADAMVVMCDERKSVWCGMIQTWTSVSGMISGVRNIRHVETRLAAMNANVTQDTLLTHNNV